MRGARALRAGLSLAATLFFLEGEVALAQPQAEPDALRVSLSYGQASAPRSQGFAETATLSVARESTLGAGFSWGVELTPLFAANQTRVDLPGHPRAVAYAVAAAPLLAWTYAPKTAKVGLRLEASIGLFWGFSPIPAQGSRFNFLDQGSGLLLVRAGGDRIVSAGFRRAHISSLGLGGPDNPGLSLYSGVVGISWPAR